MDKTDCLKFLKNNNLYNAYDVGLECINKYSLPNAVSMLSGPIDGIYNAYDLLKIRPNKVRINCGLTDLAQEAILNSGTYNANDGKLLEFTDKPILLDTEDYFFCELNQDVTGHAVDLTFNLSFSQANLPWNEITGYTLQSVNERYTDVVMSEDVYYIRRYKIGNNATLISATSVLIDQFSFVSSPPNNRFAPFSASYNPVNKSNVIVLMFGDKKKHMIYFAKYNTQTNVFHVGDNDGLLTYVDNKPKVLANIAFKNTFMTDSEITFKLNFYTYRNDKIDAWLKSIPI